ncbi:MAG: extracellular solute-binding protein [Chloroflexi bacterium]|nr:extracellular solute-binding protein [Chloroflexota bacterium]
MSITRLLSLGVVCLLLLSCAAPVAAPYSGSGGSLMPTQTSGPLVITFGAPEFQRSIYEPLIARFNQEEPAIRVQFVAIDQVYTQQRGDLESTLRQIVSLTDSAIVYTVPHEAFQNGLLLDLAPLIDADSTFNSADFFPGALERTRVDGRQYGVPVDITLPLLSYNRDLWRTAGLAPPQPDWAWSDLLAAAEALAQTDGGGDVYGLADWGAYLLLIALAQEQDPAFVWGEAGQAQLDAPMVVDALARLVALKQSRALYYIPSTSTPEQINVAIRDGRVGMWPGFALTNVPGTDHTSLPFEIGTAVVPPIEAGEVRFGRELIISSGASHPEEVWRWIAFLSRQVIPDVGSPTSPPTTFPARRSIVDQSGILSALEPETRVAIDTALTRQPGKPIPNDPLRDQALNQAIDAVLNGGQSPAAALAEAQQFYAREYVAITSTPSPEFPNAIVVASPIPTLAARQDVPRITFTALWASSIFQPLVDAFNREHPEIYVELRADNVRTGSFRLADVAQESDIVLWTGPAIGVDQEAILDLRPFADADPLYAPNDFPLAVRTRFSDDQALYGVPYQLSLWVVAYNPDLFAAAGVATPQSDWTLNDFVLAAAALSDGDGLDRRYGFYTADTALLDLFLDDEDVDLVLGSGDTIQPNYTDPKVIAAVRRFIDFVRLSTPKSSLSGYQRSVWGTMDNLIAEGRVAMWFVFFGPLLDATQKDIPVAMAPLPRSASGYRRMPFAASALFVSSKTPYPREAWTFVSWMSRNPLVSSGYVPARTSLARSPSFQAAMPPGLAEVYAAYADAFEQPEDLARFRVTEASTLAFDSFWFYRAVDRILQEPGRDIARELYEAQQLTEEYLICVRSGEVSAQCAHDVDPSYEGFQE